MNADVIVSIVVTVAICISFGSLLFLIPQFRNFVHRVFIFKKYKKLLYLIRHEESDELYRHTVYPLAPYLLLDKEAKIKKLDSLYQVVSNVGANYATNDGLIDIIIDSLKRQMKVCSVVRSQENSDILLETLDIIRTNFMNMIDYGTEIDIEYIKKTMEIQKGYNELSDMKAKACLD